MNASDWRHRQIDRAWASTAYAPKGRTVDNVVAATEEIQPLLTNGKTLRVEISHSRKPSQSARLTPVAVKVLEPKSVNRDVGLWFVSLEVRVNLCRGPFCVACPCSSSGLGGTVTGHERPIVLTSLNSPASDTKTEYGPAAGTVQ